VAVQVDVMEEEEALEAAAVQELEPVQELPQEVHLLILAPVAVVLPTDTLQAQVDQVLLLFPIPEVNVLLAVQLHLPAVIPFILSQPAVRLAHNHVRSHRTLSCD
jgi:hypothetical protein